MYLHFCHISRHRIVVKDRNALQSVRNNAFQCAFKEAAETPNRTDIRVTGTSIAVDRLTT